MPEVSQLGNSANDAKDPSLQMVRNVDAHEKVGDGIHKRQGRKKQEAKERQEKIFSNAPKPTIATPAMKAAMLKIMILCPFISNPR